ncbi:MULTISPECIES: bis(5'-nucleosyl)-tetraphosphatase (symmetrical) YqeK [unclassified Coleofasciculus]|uniref:bis(5'-nucleosyl)-tetraphosphatase (symmetrical) YqeK n=1 Tax=unclassified Coleofasciculus TaxID=2692782 RepID=UPI0018814636|nr:MULTISPECIES: bis(5'-nucleosyl)-tetraphosphatase (symmetrical) YqeK [unclassified Coleofasciculus]MBE9125094.1 bis(5'-nucleosyl)-tetraphosphatase (symmetrical) YqeK [Coleofasciculus sp. LEGE 07081]MBE9150097.1 bis(5'-nucleosyl)-tetraphosphatase (symmetrical) YqeK [Coleofasciculus sp. LEGE 07092]
MRDRVLTWLADNVPAARIDHILRVEQMSVELACHYHLDGEQAARAGLLHDLAKYFKPKVLLQIARDQGIEVDSVLAANPHLLHADASAIVAREHFGIQDEAVLQAIALHTLGRPGMSDLSCVVFLADSLEPGRGDTPELEALRQVSRQDLHKAVWLTCEYSLKLLLDTRRLIHPRMILTRNWAVQAFSEKQQSVRHSIDVLTA